MRTLIAVAVIGFAAAAFAAADDDARSARLEVLKKELVSGLAGLDQGPEARDGLGLQNKSSRLPKSEWRRLSDSRVQRQWTKPDRGVVGFQILVIWKRFAPKFRRLVK